MIFNRKPRRQMHQVTATNIEQVTPRVRRITFSAATLADFTAPTPGAHIKLFFGTNPNQPIDDPKKLRSQMRTYTPRYFNPETKELAVEFELHGDGLASTWAAQAKVGDPLTLAGPGGGMDIPDTFRNIVMLVDESAIPAAGTVLEALPSSCIPTVICEVENLQEQRSFSSTVQVTPTWLSRQEQNVGSGKLLENYLPKILADVENFDDTFWWVACEANTMRRMRSQLLQHQKIDKSKLVTRGYWKLGTSNHPDHDYGEY